MNELLQSLRTDLLSRRLLPLVALALLALVAAVGFALGGGSTATAPPPSAPASVQAGQAALAVTAASPNPNAAEAETPGGLRYQSKGALRNPFTPLPQPKGAPQSASGSFTGASSAGEGAGAGSAPSSPPGSGSGGAEPPTPPKKPSKPAKKANFRYDVSVLFGQLPATPGQEVTLPPYQNLQPQRPLPSSSDARIALERVSGDAKSAVFELMMPAILRGQGVCLPSPSECQDLALEVGHVEELEYIEESSGQPVVFELKTVSVVKKSSQAAG
jgi:hypothetical protein